MRRLLLLIAIFASTAFSAEFEVASVKPIGNSTGEPYDVQVVPGRLRMRNAPLRGLIQLAHGVEGYQLTGGPSWLASERFDIEAKAAGNPSAKQMQGPMLQALLEDRFKLTVHRETKEGPVYELRLINGARKIQPSTAGTCISYSPDEPLRPRPTLVNLARTSAIFLILAARVKTGRWMGKASVWPTSRKPWRGWNSIGPCWTGLT